MVHSLLDAVNRSAGGAASGTIWVFSAEALIDR
jgi:hypothetical protein